MYLDKLSLFYYRNILEANYQFDPKINCFVGKNGVGKTNILDAIYHLSYGKSYFNPISAQNINHDAEFFVVDGTFLGSDGVESIICSLKRGHKKILKRNAKEYAKLSDHLGFVPLVIISPSDTDLIIEGSETRRKFVDSVISQLDRDYLHKLISYQKVLLQRNALLKYFAQNRTFETDTLEIYNDQLSRLGQTIFEKRKTFVESFVVIFNRYQRLISGEAEEVSLVYESQLFEGNLNNLLIESINKDKILQYTSVGIHKDDFSFLIDDHPIKKFGSQGQQKTFLIALKLAQFDFMKKASGIKPILLLDDIFDKLDDTRVSKIVKMVNDDDFGQIFISDTHRERTEIILRSTNQSYRIYEL